MLINDTSLINKNSTNNKMLINDTSLINETTNDKMLINDTSLINKQDKRYDANQRYVFD
jgi:hypothetical protein